jgi:hypothetical protein
VCEGFGFGDSLCFVGEGWGFVALGVGDGECLDDGVGDGVGWGCGDGADPPFV